MQKINKDVAEEKKKILVKKLLKMKLSKMRMPMLVVVDVVEDEAQNVVKEKAKEKLR